MSELPGAILRAVHSAGYVAGYTHTFYRYPARLPPEFVREAIRELTAPGDIVLDPFMGGGTTIVEAIAEGRRAVGLDINPIARFVTAVKTTPLSGADKQALREWVHSSGDLPSGTGASTQDHQVRNLPPEIRSALAPFLETAALLRPKRRRDFARCVLLRVGQWALESYATPAPADAIRKKMPVAAEEMLRGLDALVEAAAERGVTSAQLRRQRHLVLTSAARKYWLQGLRRRGTPRLVITSPPYPGVHVLYHRWQVLGRRETPAPFWLADLQDGRGEAYYTFGSRSLLGTENYFTTLQRSFEAVRQVSGPDTLVVQLVAFTDVDTQLPRYLSVMEAAGFRKAGAVEDATWRLVPHRRWYTQIRDSESIEGASRELMLVHRPCST